MKILVAEDQADLARLLQIAIERQGFSVDIAHDGQVAVDLAMQNAYDVMILDIMMPVKDGLTALKEMRQAGNDAYVIMLTAMAEIDDRVTGLDAGADDYMTKPYSIQELMARLRSLDRRDKQFETGPINVANLTFDPQEQRLVAHTSVRLGATEARVLKVLLANPNKTFPASQLLNVGWESTDGADETDLWITISYLKQKLAAIDAHVTITGDQLGPFTLITTVGDQHDD